MPHSIDDLQRIGLKVFVESAHPPAPREFVPIFHRWIQTGAVDGLLIDVADYSHLEQGPSIVLVAHEANYALDFGDGRMGLQYYRKQSIDGPLDVRLTTQCRALLTASRLLEEDPAFGGRLQFRGDELQLVANDCLLAPNTAETRAQLESPVSAFAAKLFGSARRTMTHSANPRQRFTLTIKTVESASLEQLLARLG